MITTINEFKTYLNKIYEFGITGHYLTTSFKKRIKDAIIENDLNDLNKANNRFQQAMSYIAISLMSILKTADDPIGIVFGDIYFIENGSMIKAEISADGDYKRNIYVCIIRGKAVNTILLLPSEFSNLDILNKLNVDPSRGIIKLLKDTNLNDLSVKNNTHKRPNIIINLDISDKEFNKIYPTN